MADDSNTTNPPGGKPGVDIVERMRRDAVILEINRCFPSASLLRAAADEIERLRAQNAVYEEELLSAMISAGYRENVADHWMREFSNRARKALSLARGDSQ
jgi:hypothetical protein